MHEFNPNTELDMAKARGIPYWGEWQRAKIGYWRTKCVWCVKRMSLNEPAMKRRDLTTGKNQWAHEYCMFLSEL